MEACKDSTPAATAATEAPAAGTDAPAAGTDAPVVAESFAGVLGFAMLFLNAQI